MKKKIPTFIGITVLVVGIAVGVFMVKNRQIFKLRASADKRPKDIRITNLSDSAFTVTFTTGSNSSTFVKWGEDQNNLQNTQTPQTASPSYVHSVTVSNLAENKTYYFKINSEGLDFDNDGIAWETKTGKKLSAPESSIIISGKTLDANDLPLQGVLVYSSVSGGSDLSTVTNSDGVWILPISLTRTADLNSYVSISETETLLDISVQAGQNGITTAKIYPELAMPAPNMYLGQSYDFRNISKNESSSTPGAEINLDTTESRKSGFIANSNPVSQDTVTLESVENGEVVTTTEPEFFGGGPPGTDITITVQSETITDTVTVEDDGFWRWSIPKNLEAGLHTITLSWKDENGVLKKITKSFVVNAQEGPAFVATPSASPTPTSVIAPTITPTMTPTPTKTPSLTPSVSPTATPTLKPTSTPTKVATPSSTLPDAGYSAPTFFTVIIGLSLVVFSAFVILNE